MDKLFFLSYCISNTLLYSLVKFFHIKLHGLSTIHVMGYSNLLALMLILPYIVWNFRAFIRHFVKSLGLTIGSFAGALKVYSVQYISPKTAMVIAMTQPIFIVILSLLTIEKSYKIDLKRYSYLLISLIGMYVFLKADFQGNIVAYAIMFVHVVLKAISNVYLKKISSNQYITWSYGVLFYSIFTSSSLLESFDYHFLYNKYIIILTIISLLCQLSIILSYKLTKQISLLQNMDYSRLVFSFIWTYLLFKEPILEQQVVGVLIIMVSIYLSQNDIKFSNKKHKT